MDSDLKDKLIVSADLDEGDQSISRGGKKKKKKVKKAKKIETDPSEESGTAAKMTGLKNIGRSASVVDDPDANKAYNIENIDKEEEEKNISMTITDIKHDDLSKMKAENLNLTNASL